MKCFIVTALALLGSQKVKLSQGLVIFLGILWFRQSSSIMHRLFLSANERYEYRKNEYNAWISTAGEIVVCMVAHSDSFLASSCRATLELAAAVIYQGLKNTFKCVSLLMWLKVCLCSVASWANVLVTMLLLFVENHEWVSWQCRLALASASLELVWFYSCDKWCRRCGASETDATQ